MERTIILLSSWSMLKRKRSNLESSRAAARQRRKLRSTAEAEAEALAKSTRHDDDPDRISELPDKIIHHILSFLDMKHVIHTAFLSKRWTTIFKSLPSLSLDQNSYETTRRGNDIYKDIHSTKFIDFVDRVLCLRDSADNNNDVIGLLHVTWFDKEVDMNRVTDWIDFAVRHNVQDLGFTLALGGNLYNDLLTLSDHHPPSLFSCKLLTTLKLEATESAGVMIPHDIVVDLPKLKTLHVGLLCFNGEKINENFFSKCPVLETLIITHCQLESDTLNILLSRDHPLKYLKLDSLYKLNKHQCFHITISAPKLTSLSIRDDDKIFGDYNLVNMHSLVKARIISYEIDSRSQMKFLNDISYVKSLSLSVDAVGNHAFFKNLLNPFHNLRVLKLLMNTPFERNEMCSIFYLLRKCPYVETLALKMSTLEHRHERGTIVYTDGGKACEFRLDQLKFIEVRGFTECHPNLLEFLGFMLRLTPVLEKIFIYGHKEHLTFGNKERCRALLANSIRVSSKTEFFFIQTEPYVWCALLDVTIQYGGNHEVSMNKGTTVVDLLRPPLDPNRCA